MANGAPPATATMQGGDEATLSSSSIAQIQHIGDLSDKIALITGGSSGFGRAISQAYAAAGAYVVSADLTPNPPKTPILENTMKASGIDMATPTVDLVNKRFPSKTKVPRMMYVQTDVTNSASMEAAVAFTVQNYGRLDIMVNNAGISAETGQMSGRTHEMDEAIWDKDMAVNAKGVWLGIKYAAGQMVKQEPHSSGDRGWIINMCSIMGLIAIAGAGPYCASKGAVLQMTKATALEYAKDRIHINCINPGFCETNLLEPMMASMGSEAAHAFIGGLHPWGRLGLPDDIAKMAVFLAGPGASFITGAPFVVDGGYIAQ